SNSLVSARRAAIDNELAELSRKVALLKAERNSLAPIATLPNELLVRILVAFTAGTALSMRQPSTLAKLIFVCRHWANIIAAFPTLWDEITLWSLPSRRSLEAQLLRSGVAPVGIYILQFSSFHYTPLILANVARIKALDLAGERSDLVEFLQAMQEVDFPMLRSLALIAYESAQPVPDVHLPRDLFRRMPSLCNLELREIDAPWEYLPPLRSLRLSVKHTSSLNPFPLPVLFNLLKSSPTLHTLKLDLAIQAGSVNSSLRVDLPQLKLLHLSTMLGHCEDLINRLTFPASTRLLLYPEYIRTVEDIRHILVPIRNLRV
ncbi:hypothetical protein B0H16DRAFT_1325845, partial [Mycena metata]